jgi:3-oxoacyl-[acyl-carrier protein] reductase
MSNHYQELFALDDEIALVTGASRGIGAEIADTLGRAGATVIGTATSPEGADAITERFSSTGIDGRGAVLDLGDFKSVTRLQEDVTKHDGVVTILVNNAGIARDNLLMRMKDDEWDEILNVNLSSVYHLSKAFMRGMMKARHGRIISISSVVGVMGNAGQANYAAAKAGLIGFSKSLAREVGSRDITVNVVAPGFIQTGMTAGLSEGQRDDLSDRIPLNRLGRVEDVAAAVLYLASGAGNYVTGETINVNGGMYMI